ncbi:MAG: hypothetical protein PF440_03565 [Thiomicrorhabdus sp.]|jgi:hypothetical protein|nr:hypothetical protein [Thiomicrorhabdus sp.]
MLKIKKTFNIYCQLGLIGLIGLSTLSVQAEEMGPDSPPRVQTPALYSETAKQSLSGSGENAQQTQKRERKRTHKKAHNQSGQKDTF